jgi:hypothetical protein
MIANRTRIHEPAERMSLAFESPERRAGRFIDIYQRRLWGAGNEHSPVSGPGSTLQWSANARAALADVIHDFGITSLLDAPCGDRTWIVAVDLSGVRYTGVDIVPELIEQHRASNCGNDLQFEVLDVVTTVPPEHNLILCRHLLNHLCPGDVMSALANFSASGARWLLTTTFLGAGQGILGLDSSPETSVPINLFEAPYSLPDPVRLYREGGHVRDRQFLGLWQLPIS